MKLNKQKVMEHTVKYGAKAAEIAATGFKKAGLAMEGLAGRLHDKNVACNTQPKHDHVKHDHNKHGH